MIIALGLSFVGHVVRKPTSMKNSIVVRKIEGTKRRGRPRPRWMDGMGEAASMTQIAEGKIQKSRAVEKSDYGSHSEPYTARWNFKLMCV